MEEPSQILGATAEECHSSESGWTMYIGSPIHDDDDDHVDDTHQAADPEEDDDDQESDDSMASDASSGPSLLWSKGDFKKQQEIIHEENKCFFDKKACKTEQGKQIEGKKVEKKEKSPVQNSGKVRKYQWVGKRK